MCDVIRHRGPDDEGKFTDDRVGLGVRRLSIIDVEGGHQPIHNEDETVWIVFNGEVYNYVELRQQLEASGHRFYTKSDTEVVVHLYEDRGLDAVSSLRGMFAFALWDRPNRRLLLARDRLGKKPLYYAFWDGIFLFGSEAKSILQYLELTRIVNMKAIDYFLTYSYIPAPLTAFQGISKLPASSLLVFEKGKVMTESYWDLSFAINEEAPISVLLERFDSILREAVKIRLRSDVPLGAFLSGGIDSSAVVSIAARQLDSPLKTFSIGFEAEDYNELPYAREVASYLKTDHHELVLKPEVIKILPILVWHNDEPFADASAIPTYYVSQLARKHVKVVLTGDGGDEMFMGYPWLADPIKGNLDIVRNRMRSLKRKAKAAIERPSQKKLSYSSFDTSSVGGRYLSRVAHLGESDLEEIYTEDAKSGRNLERTSNFVMQQFQKAENSAHARESLSKSDYVTIKTYLAEDILVKVDRASMAVSLEARCPFLDHVLGEFIAGVPSNFKMKDDQTKIILKKYLLERNILPRQILERSKQGFGIPLEHWFIGDLKVALETALLDQKSRVRKYINESYIESTMADRSTFQGAQRLYALIMLELWHRMFIETETRGPPPLDFYHYF